jgi:di/tricarboxylate transporter
MEDLVNFLSSDEDNGLCPCPHRHRFLEDLNSTSAGPTHAPNSSDTTTDEETWEIVYTCVVLVIMFLGLISERLGADNVMLVALTAFMAGGIITIQEGLAGFSNQGLLTVLVLFVVAEGISKTGALDWYMTKLLGEPKTVASAQLRLMLPVATVSAFLNNTPIVVVMIPIVLRWAKNNRISPKKLLIPLSFSAIFGGTCTLIGTSTNLVVVGLLEERYPNDSSVKIGLFDLAEYGIPVAMAGLAYVLLMSPFLLPGNTDDSEDPSEAILLGARVTQWSPAAGRTVQRSGLRDTGGIFLVSVHRAATGNVHRAVSRDFVLNVGDTLYFTGLVESFGEFCEEHGLEVVTHEVATTATVTEEGDPEDEAVTRLAADGGPLPTVQEYDEPDDYGVPVQVGVTKESLLKADEEERLRSIHRMTDLIRGAEPADKNHTEKPLRGHDPAKTVVAIDGDLIVVGINAHDRPGLLLDLSKGLLRLRLQLRHTEAAVLGDRSVSIWRCEVIDNELPDLEEIWSVLSALLSVEGGIEAVKKRGLRVIRARVVKGSQLVGKTAAEVDFRKVYKAAIVTVQNGLGGASSPSMTRFQAGDILVLQASDDSALLKRPPDGFYEALLDASKDNNQSQPGSRSNSVRSLVNLVTRRGGKSATDFDEADESNKPAPLEVRSRMNRDDMEDDFFIPSEHDSNSDMMHIDEEVGTANLHDTGNLVAELEREESEAVWRDLQVILLEKSGADGGAREFLTAMAVARRSNLAGKTASQIGIHKLPNLFLVSIDRPQQRVVEDRQRRTQMVQGTPNQVAQRLPSLNDGSVVSEQSEVEGSVVSARTEIFTAITQQEPLAEGDVLWFSGPATAVGDLRKIPGLLSYENEEVEKINEKVFDRRLVQAVVARKGELVGKTVKDLRFRSRYGAAVIAVHREGKRVHEHPGKVKLQAGDVLLLEAGPSFIAKGAENDRSFALLAEVEDSAPPRLSLLIPALVITAGMLIFFTAGLASLLVCGLVASILMVALGILSEQEARDAVNWEVYITIAAAFGIGTALVNSGVADSIASFLVDIGTAMGIGDAGLFGAVYFATFLISNVVTNNAAAALLFPIAMNAAETTGTDRVLMSYALMLGASASFMSPYGYTTNLLIYGPGGYKYKDFLMFGFPMQIVLWVLSTAYLSVIRPWYLSWLGTGLVLVLVAAVRVGGSSLSGIFRRAQSGKSNERKVETSATKVSLDS